MAQHEQLAAINPVAARLTAPASVIHREGESGVYIPELAITPQSAQTLVSGNKSLSAFLVFAVMAFPLFLVIALLTKSWLWVGIGALPIFGLVWMMMTKDFAREGGFPTFDLRRADEGRGYSCPLTPQSAAEIQKLRLEAPDTTISVGTGYRAGDLLPVMQLR